MRSLPLLLLAACAAPAIEGTWVPADEAPLGVEIDGSRSADLPGARLRVVTYNVHFGEDVAALADALAGAGDILLLQEIESYPDEDGSRAARLAALLAMNHVYAPARAEGDGTHGLALLSRYAIDDVEIMQLPDIEQPWHDRARIALAATVGGLRVVDVHLDTRANLTDRVRQLHPAIATLGEPVVVAGDMNTDPYLWIAGGVPLVSLAALDDLDQGTALDDYMDAMDFDTPTAGAGDTFFAGPLSLRLDAIYTRGPATGDAGVLDTDASDHLPLWLDLSPW